VFVESARGDPRRAANAVRLEREQLAMHVEDRDGTVRRIDRFRAAATHLCNLCDLEEPRHCQ